MKNIDTIIFDFAGTLVRMRPATLLTDRNILELLSNKYKLGIITGGKRAEVLNIVNKLKLNEFFQSEYIVTKDDSVLQKPNPKLILILLKKIKSKRAIYTGDSSKDRKMANLACVPFLEPSELLRLEEIL